jgi:hypothetical protein
MRYGPTSQHAESNGPVGINPIEKPMGGAEKNLGQVEQDLVRGVLL